MKKWLRKFDKLFSLGMAKMLTLIKAGYSTKIQYKFYKRWGMKFNGKPNYLSPYILFDGTGYDLIEIGEGVTMSSYIRVLTHDWALHTVAKAFNIKTEKPLGRIRPIKIGDFTFIGTGTILMPGCDIGRGCIIAAGTVVRGNVPDFSIYAGSPGKVIGNSKTYLSKFVDIPPESH